MMNTAPFPPSHGELHRPLLKSPVRCVVFLALTLLLVALPVHQVSAATGGPDAYGYTFTDSVSGGVTYGFEDISLSGGTALAGLGDDVHLSVALPFSFNFYGTAYSTCYVNTNGFLSFDSGSGVTPNSYQPTTLPSAGVPNAMIAGLWRDLFPTANTIFYQTIGTAPNRRFVVLFKGVVDRATSNANTFEFKLFETSNRVEVHYQTLATGFATTMGIENAAGNIGLQYYNGAALPAAVVPFAVRFSPSITVTNTNDSGAGSLRQAITDVSAGGRIVFAPALNGQTITLGGTQIAINKGLTIDGSSLADGITISGNPTTLSRVFQISSGNVTMDSVTISGGDAGTGYGGGILVNSGTLTLNNATISNCSGGFGGGIFTYGTALTINHSTFFGNSSVNSGAGIYSFSGTVSTNHSTFSGNTAVGGSYGGIHSTGPHAIANSIIAANTPNDLGGGGVVTPAGVNLLGTLTGSGLSAGPTVVVGAPQLAPLGNYGGPTPTMPPLPGSPAIDAAGASDPGGSDQRGASRFVNGALDIGAVEFQPTIVTTVVDEDNVVPGTGLSLREAIASEFASFITFDPTLSGKTITLGGTQLLINKSLAIDASGLNQGITISGNNASRVFMINSGNTVVMDRIDITAASVASNVFGGAISNSGNLTVRNASFSGNFAGFGAVIFNETSGSVSIDSSTFSGNSAGTTGGAIFSWNNISIRNSTFFGNSATYGGSIGIFGGGSTIESCTLAGSSASNSGGGIHNSGSSLTLTNSIVANNISPLGPDIRESSGSISPAGINLLSNLAGSTLSAGSTVLVGDAMLSALGYYGGPTQTMHPLVGSPAIDPVGGATSSALATDQRGFARVIDGNSPADGTATLDIGAVEAGPVLKVTTTANSGAGSLREHLATATADAPAIKGYHIVFDDAVFPGTLTSVIPELSVATSDVFIDASDIGGSGVQVSGGSFHRVFSVASTATAAIHGLTIRDSTTFGGVISQGSLTLVKCTVSDNVGGGFSDGGGFAPRTVFDHCTISGNVTTSGNGNAAGGILVGGQMRLTHCTVSNNVATDGNQTGGISVFGSSTRLILENSIVAGNQGGSNTDLKKYVFATLVRRGTNLIGDNTSATAEFPAGSPNPNGDYVGTTGALIEPLLAPLADYGGRAPTMIPLPGSPAIDAATTSKAIQDQRGVPRPVGVFNDIGAVEAVPLSGVSPADGAPLLSTLPTLEWAAPVEATQFEVFLGTDPNNLVSLGFQSSPFIPSGLLAGTTYYWVVESTVGNGVARSAVSTFTTRTSLVVTTIADENDGALGVGAGDSLREAIADAVPGELVTFDGLLNGKIITLGGSQLLIDKDLTIDAAALERGITIDANGAVTNHRVFQVTAGNTVTMDSLTITGGKGAGGGGAGILNHGTLLLNRSTVSGNETAPGNWGGGILTDGALVVTHCTIANNSAAYGGGIFIASGSATLDQVTLSDNTAATGGGGLWQNGGALTINNTIVAGNTAPSALNLAGSFTGGNNLTSGDPMLSPLGYYGGPTQTMHPLVGSPAIDPVGGATSSGLANDQRGFARVVDGDSPADATTTVDIGAVEAGPVLLVTTNADSGAGSLRDRLATAAGSPTVANHIVFDAGAFPGVITLSSELSVSGQTVFIDSSDIEGTGVRLSGGTITRVLGIYETGIAAIHSLTIRDGSAPGSGSAGCGGGIYNFGALTLVKSTVSGNSASTFGGGICVDNGTHPGLLVLNHCTVSGNQTSAGMSGGIMNFGKARLTHCTVSDNEASTTGGGIRNANGLTLENSIVAGNQGSASPDIENVGIITQRGLNVIGDTTGNSLTGPLVNTDPLLSPLGNWGGATQTMYPRPGSPAIDAGPTTALPFQTDQRGRARVDDGDDDGTAALDIGAYEVGTTVITSFADNGPGTLRAILGNVGHEWVSFDAGVFDGTPATTITLASELAVVGEVLHLDAFDISGGVTLSGNDVTRIFSVNAAGILEIDGLTLTHGHTPGGGSGAGIYALGAVAVKNSVFTENASGWRAGAIEGRGPLSLENVIFTNNSAASDGGAVFFNDSSLLVVSACTVSGNSSGGAGGGIWSGDATTVTNSSFTGNTSALEGGGLLTNSTTLLTDCTLSGNTAGGSGGGLFSNGTISLTNSTVSANTSGGDGGGLWSPASVTLTDSTISANTSAGDGGGVRSPSGTISLTRSTVSSNAAGGSGGGLWSGGSVTLINATIANNFASLDGGGVRDSGGTLSLTSSTVSGNVAGGTGGGLWADGALALSNALVAGNRALVSNDIHGEVTIDNGGNLVGDGTGMSGMTDGTNSNQVGTGSQPIDPGLAPLGDYGGSTRTMQLLAGSPALNMGLSGGSIPTTGQRGFPRVGATDIGAQEAGPVILVSNPNDSGSGSLRQAIANATAPGVRILFNLTSATNLIGLNTGELSVPGGRTLFIDASALVDGFGNVATEPDPLRSGETIVPRGVTVSGNDSDRVMSISSGSTVGLHGMTITDGIVPGGNGGGVLNNGDLTVNDSAFSGNSATYGGGILSFGSKLTVNNSTFSDNSAVTSGGGIYNQTGILTVNGSTVSGNSALFGGAIFNNSGNVTVNNATIAGNSASNGGGIRLNNGSLSLTNSIISNNSATSTGPDIDYTGTITPTGVNLIGDLAGSSLSPGSSVIVGDPILAPLADNGGMTLTMMPLPGSPAIDAGFALERTPFTDQRGFARILAGGLDIGAYETGSGDFNPAGLTLFSKVPEAVGAGGTMRFEISTDSEFLPSVVTMAGTGSFGVANGAPLASKFSFPSDIAEDSFGNLFIADSGNNLIRMITPAGVVSTVAGSGSFGYIDNDNGLIARFAFPSGVAVGPDDNVYVSDTINHCIRKLTRPELAGLPWKVTTLAGFGYAGFMDGTGTSTLFDHPHGLTVDSVGNLYVADTENQRIRKVTPAGVVSTYAGTGAIGSLDHVHRLSAKFSAPFGVAVNPDGDVFVADRDNHRICRISGFDQRVITVAGTGSEGLVGGLGPDPDSEEGPSAWEDPGVAQFKLPTGVAVDSLGNIIVADRGNHAIRKLAKPINPADPWVVTTVAGTGVAGFADGRATSSGAQFRNATGVHVVLNGDILIADEGNHRIRRIAAPLFVDASQGAQDPYGRMFSATIDSASRGLVPETVYYFRWVASDGSSQVMGESFTLVPIPAVVTTAATDLTPTSATINGTVDPNGTVTTVTFDYSTEPDLDLGPLSVETLIDGAVDPGLSNPNGMAVDAAGNVYVADKSANKILKITPEGVVSDYAGSGVAGFADGPGVTAQFDNPIDVAIDAAGNLYVADELNHRIRMITTGQVVTTIAGSGVAGFANAPVATAGQFLFPCGVAVKANGSKVYVADRGNHRVRVISSGTLATLAGSGTAGFANGSAATAKFNNPTGVAVDVFGNVYVADRDNHRIRLVNPGNQVLTAAGSGAAGFSDGAAASAKFAFPTDVAVDSSGNIHVADRDNHCLRVIDNLGVVSTMAGSGVAGIVDSEPGDLFPATAMRFSGPTRIAVSSNGTVFLTEQGSKRVRRAIRNGPLSITLPETYSSNGDIFLGTALPETLLSGATYYFRIRAENFQGPALGEVLSFITPSYPEIAVFDGADTEAAELLDAQPAVIDMGITPLGLPVVRQFTIGNSGEYKLDVSAINVPAGYQVTGGLGEIAPGASLTFDVTLDASIGGTFSGDVEIISDDSDESSFTVPITGVVLDPPTVVTLDADNIVNDLATLNGSVNPEGSATTVWFEYSQDPELDGVLVTTIAGASSDYAEGTGTGALFNEPRALAMDADGNLYVADTQNHRIRKIAPDGTSSTVAGTGTPGTDDGPVASAQFNEPVGLVLGQDGTIYVADSLNHRIRAISPSGVVSTHSGLGVAGFTDGDGSAARFNVPKGLAIDAGGTLYVADSANDRIRKVAPDGTASTLATFNAPLGVAVDSAGIAYVTRTGSHAIHRIQTGGAVDVYAGSATTPDFVDDTGAAARFFSPAGLAVDASDSLYVADSGNERIRKIAEGGTVTTLAGAGTTEATGPADGPGFSAEFDNPVSVTANASGDVFVGELTYSTIRRISPDTVVVEVATDLNGFSVIPVSLPLTGIDPEDIYYFRVFATNGGGTTFGDDILSFGGTISSPSVSWQVEMFGAEAGNPLIAGWDADPSHDGVTNLMKYALGLDPNVSSRAGLPVIGLNGGMLTLAYNKVIAATDLVYVVEVSANLADWSTLGVTEQELGDNGTTRQILASTPVSGSPTKYLRLRVTFLQP